VSRRVPRTPAGPPAAAPAGRRRIHPLRRHLIGATVIAVCTTVAISVAVINVVSTIADDFGLAGAPLDSKNLTAAKGFAPQTILVIGDNHIGPTTTYATGAAQTVNGYHYLHADTFMLVRMDPAKNQTSILSIPRDLVVTFHYRGQPYTDKFNSTYSLGGDDLVERVAEATLPGITINHVIDFNFASFLQLIDAIGCVYVDVDHRYLNPGDASYLPINIEPGYQRLCGNQALSYVRYRHTDSDFVRVARQQDFIRQAKEQLGAWGFITRYGSLAKAFGKAVWTDIRSAHDVAQLLDLAFFSLSKPVRQVPFEYNNSAFQINTSQGPAEAVTSTPQLIRQSVDNFLYRTPAPALPGATTTTSTTSTSHTTHAAHHSHHHAATVSPAAHDLYAVPADVAPQALGMSVNVDFPIYLPTLQTGPASVSDFHSYRIGDEQHHLHYGYRVDWSDGSEGEYYGIEGMNWTDPPLFANPNATEKIGTRDYMFVTDGGHIRYIGWRQGPALYWVSNTLNEDLTNAQMLAIARSAEPLHT